LKDIHKKRRLLKATVPQRKEKGRHDSLVDFKSIFHNQGMSKRIFFSNPIHKETGL